ncbi:MAG: HepT-like ribonuclease domain-containing protein [Chloroflexota bacterium]
MTPRDTRHIVYILGAIKLIEERTEAGRESFLGELAVQDAVLWRLYTLADATLRLSEELKALHPEIPWERIRGYRNIAAHGYLDLLIEVAWEIIEEHLPMLRTVLASEP